MTTIYTVQQVASECRVSKQSVYRAIEEGLIKGERAGIDRHFFTGKQLEAAKRHFSTTKRGRPTKSKTTRRTTS